MRHWNWNAHAQSVSLYYVVIPKNVERVQNELGSAVNNTGRTATSRTAATAAVARSYCMRRTLKSTYVPQHYREKTCALPILAHMSHITISFASILFSYFHLLFTVQSTTHIRCQMLHITVLCSCFVECSWKNNRTNLGLSALHSRIAFNVYCVLYNMMLLLSIVRAQGWPKKMAGWLTVS